MLILLSWKQYCGIQLRDVHVKFLSLRALTNFIEAECRLSVVTRDITLKCGFKVRCPLISSRISPTLVILIAKECKIYIGT